MHSVLDEPRLTPDKISVVFTVSSHGRTTECFILKRALVEYFWAPHDASDARLLKAFADGSKRIAAVAARKLLAGQAQVVLSSDDFARM
jgi:hypothetical protein